MLHTPNLMLLADSPESLRDLLRSLLEEMNVTAPASSPTPANSFLTMEDVCREFGISRTTLNDWMKKGIVPFIRLGRRIYFELAAILEAGRSHTKYMHSKSK